jgi:hypothetical protein
MNEVEKSVYLYWLNDAFIYDDLVLFFSLCKAVFWLHEFNKKNAIPESLI